LVNVLIDAQLSMLLMTRSLTPFRHLLVIQ